MIRIAGYTEDEFGRLEKQIGSFYIPDDVTNEWLEKHIPPIIRVIQLLAGKIKKTGY
jgi:hypothetical protein